MTAVLPQLRPASTGCPLSAPTRDRDAARQDLAEHGYCILEDALDPAAVATLRERLTEQAAGEDAAGSGFHDSGANQRLWMLVNKGRVFRDLVLHEVVDTFMGQLLGEAFLLSSLTANIARPGGVSMVLHRDQGYVDVWTEKPMVANIAWMLDEFTEENGATRLVPGSHLGPGGTYTQADTVAGVGPAGAALVFDGRLVHGTGENRTPGSQRHALLSYFCRPFMRQQENFFLGLAPELRATESPALLSRRGYRIWAGLGRTDAPVEGGLTAALERPTGELDRAGARKTAPKARA